MQATNDPLGTNQYQQRLIEGFVAAIEEKGYAATTIADIVRHARVSKRTFYESFADKGACFVGAYAALSEVMLATIAAAASPELPWRAQIHAAATAYIGVLESRPALTRTFFLEILSAGPKALEVRRDVNRRFAEQLRSLVARARRNAKDEIRPLSPAMATAIVGGINELILVSVTDPETRLANVAKTAVELIEAVVGS
jgi:AcrR family transcriptional regulator